MPEAWVEEAERLICDEGVSWRDAARTLAPEHFPDLDLIRAAEKIRTKLRRSDRYAAYRTTRGGASGVARGKPDKPPVGVFSDPHIPFDHPNYLRFCIDTFKKYGVGQIVCCGDLTDFHAISRHEKEPCAKSAPDELDMSIAKVGAFVKEFPKLKLCVGNHDERVIAQAASVGIDRRFLRTYPELLGLPKTWEVAQEFIIDGVLYKHGVNCCGKDGALNAAIQERMSTVIGHSHAFAGVKYSANTRDLIFGLNVGCWIDVGAYAFAYGRHEKYRPILGCGIVFNASNAVFVPMGVEYFRD